MLRISIDVDLIIVGELKETTHRLKMFTSPRIGEEILFKGKYYKVINVTHLADDMQSANLSLAVKEN